MYTEHTVEEFYNSIDDRTTAEKMKWPEIGLCKQEIAHTKKQEVNYIYRILLDDLKSGKLITGRYIADKFMFCISTANKKRRQLIEIAREQGLDIEFVKISNQHGVRIKEIKHGI